MFRTYVSSRAILQNRGFHVCRWCHHSTMRIFSGIQPTGVPHIGNYIGAISQWLKLQREGHQMLLSVVDLHSITVPHPKGQQLSENIMEMFACLVACGIDPVKTTLFQQSAVAAHTELCWLLGCLATLPRLQHLPQWKEKSQDSSEVSVGLFTYPVLQSADILLYQATHVPVGDDQVKHIELTRHLARLFNKQYGQLFPEPKAIVSHFPRIRSLRSPANKMSKSDKAKAGTISLLDTADDICRKVGKAVTDSRTEVTYDTDSRPGVSNLLEIHAALSGVSVQESAAQFTGGKATVLLKDSVSSLLVEKLSPIRTEYVRLREDPVHLNSLLQQGNETAQWLAQPVITQAKQLIGILPVKDS